MKSINGINWKVSNIPERKILKNKQNFNISYLLSKVFLDKEYTEEEIHNSIHKTHQIELIYRNKDFENASDFISKSLINKKKILIFGDYDVDGYSSTYLLYDYLSSINLKCDYYIPDRLSDGYGPNINLLRKLIYKNNYSLIIFVDCGSNSTKEIEYLVNCGVKIIVIDHHQIHENKKFKKTIIINPLKDFSSKDYNIFCATTLVYFFIKFLSQNLKIKKKIELDKYLFFCSVATICDQMPLRGYNKLVVNNGFKNFDLNKYNNFKKLLNIKHKITSTDVGFSLGPILNSASRLGQSNLPFNLLIENKNSEIEKISQNLINLNEKRKIIQNKTIKIIKEEKNNDKPGVIFNYKENINEGMLGIIASNFVDHYNKPSFVLTNSNTFIKCSSRSIKGYDIGKIFYMAIKKKIIINGGGHSMAGGCTLKKENLKQFKRFLDTIYKKKFKNLRNIKYYIGDQNFNSLKFFAKYDLEKLEPLGNDNNNPFFLIKRNRIIKIIIIKEIHLQLIIKNKYNKSCTCFAFNVVGTKLGDLLMNFKKDIDFIVQINNKKIRKNSDFNLIIKDAIV